MKFAPICLFTYNRLEETKKTIEALSKNNLAKESNLYVFSDGYKSEPESSKIKEVRQFLKTVKGFKKVEIYESEENKGLANSIIYGVNQLFKKYEKVIVLEDDLVSSPNFLDFMNQALTFYEDKEDIFSISGYTMNLPSLKKKKDDFYLSYRASSWGWGTWKRSWVDIDWKIKDYDAFNQSLSEQRSFQKGGVDLPGMLRKQMKGKIDSWAIRWCYNQFKREQYTVYAKESKIESIGAGESATHTKSVKRFETQIDTSNKREFVFQDNPKIDQQLAKEFRQKFSLFARALDKIGL